ARRRRVGIRLWRLAPLVDVRLDEEIKRARLRQGRVRGCCNEHSGCQDKSGNIVHLQESAMHYAPHTPRNPSNNQHDQLPLRILADTPASPDFRSKAISVTVILDGRDICDTADLLQSVAHIPSAALLAPASLYTPYNS